MKKYNKVDLISKLEVRTIELSLKNKCRWTMSFSLSDRVSKGSIRTFNYMEILFGDSNAKILGTLHTIIQSQASMDIINDQSSGPSMNA